MEIKTNKNDAEKPRLPSLKNFIKAIKFATIICFIFLIIIIAPTGVKLILIGLFMIFMPTIMLVSVSGYKDWEIVGEFLKVNEYTIIKISDMRIGIVNENSEWSPIMPKHTGGFPGLISDRMMLKNRKTALVFYHPVYTRYLIINVSELYYVISHPGIDKLYVDLISHSAQKQNF